MLLTGNALASQTPGTAAFTPPGDSQLPGGQWEFTLAHPGSAADGFELVRDDFAIALRTELRIGELPPLEVSLQTDGGWIVPVQRGPRATGHPYWELMVEPGRLWADPEDPGRIWASLPFALKEISQNCLHNGLLRFSFTSEGKALEFDWLIAMETCQYLKFNAWGRDNTVSLKRFRALRPGDAHAVSDHLEYIKHRLPIKPIESIGEDFPGVDPGPFQPPNQAHTSVYGYVTGGIHYRGGCQTRFGAHPFCDELALPSYSTAKSLFAGMAYMEMAHEWPELKDTMVLDLVPECDLEDRRWEGVLLRHLLDMTTGNYDSSVYHVDESSARMQPFFLATTNKEKLKQACELWPRKSAPGTQPVYHTTDDYLLGVALQRYLGSRIGESADLHRGILLASVVGAIQPSQLLWHSQRTYDADAQPFVAYGLFFLPDDVARIGLDLLAEVPANGIERPYRDAYLFRDRTGMQQWELARGEGYNMGFWGFDIGPYSDCPEDTWIPFMSGYGGIIWALLPNGDVYYFFGDGGHGSWMDAVIEAHKINKIC